MGEKSDLRNKEHLTHYHTRSLGRGLLRLLSHLRRGGRCDWRQHVNQLQFVFVILEVIPALLVCLARQSLGNGCPVSPVLLEQLKKQGFLLRHPLLLGGSLLHTLIPTFVLAVVIFQACLALFRSHRLGCTCLNGGRPMVRCRPLKDLLQPSIQELGVVLL